MTLSGWGRFPRHECRLTRPRSEPELRARLEEGDAIARGNGRAYGDSAVSRNNTVDMRAFNRMIAFDPATGQLVAEAGVLLQDVISTFLPRGWFPFVTPGTKFVTLGGMVAADVHGKNHHKDGSFGTFIDWIDVMTPGGSVERCSRGQNRELFGWTVGGMGLTGIILRAAFRLRRVETAWIRQTVMPAANLGEAMAIFETHNEATYSVAWIDCLSTGAELGRSLVVLGEHAGTDELSRQQRGAPLAFRRRPGLSVPMDLPSLTLNGFTIRAFNAAYYRKGVRTAGESLTDWDRFFYPLDAVLGWNRIYGRRGFAQFQCVLPLCSSEQGLRSLLEAVSRSRQGSFLAVLKRFGAQRSHFSFPMEGYTLALDFPVTDPALRLLEDLDAIAIQHGGRFYLAKDSRMRPDTLRRSDPRAETFRTMRDGAGLTAALASAQSKRLRL